MAKENALSLDFIGDDVQLTDFEDLSQFPMFHEGTHQVTLNWSASLNGKKEAVYTAEFVLEEHKELADASLEPQPAGYKSSVTFNTETERGRSNLRQVLTPLAKHFDTGSVVALIEKSNGMSVQILTKVNVYTKADGDEGKAMNIKRLIVA